MEGEKVAINFSFYKKIILYLFSICAFDLRSYRNQSDKKERKRLLIKDFCFLLCVFNGFLFFLLTFLKNVKDPSNAKLFIISLNVLGAGTIAVLRNLIIFFTKSEIAEILTSFDHQSYSISEMKKFNFEGYVKFFNRFFRFMCFNFVSTTSFIFLTPIVTLITTGEQTLPIISPFSNVSYYFYPFALIYSFWSFTSLCCTLSGAEVIYGASMLKLSIEFEILKGKLEDLSTKNDAEQIDLMIAFVNRHNELSNYVVIVERIFSLPLFFNIATSSLFICFCAFSATVSVTEITDSIGMVYYCISSLIQVFYQCYFGQILKTSCENLSREIYNYKWEEVKNVEVRKGIILMLERSQNPNMVTLMKFADISLQPFTSASNYSWN